MGHYNPITYGNFKYAVTLAISLFTPTFSPDTRIVIHHKFVLCTYVVNVIALLT